MSTVTVRWPAPSAEAPEVKARLVHWKTPPHTCYFWPTTSYPRSKPCRMGIYVAADFPTSLTVYLPLSVSSPTFQLPILPGVTLLSYCSSDVVDWGAAYDVPVQGRILPASTEPVPFMLDLSIEGAYCVTLEAHPSDSGVFLDVRKDTIGAVHGTFSRPLHADTDAPFGMLYIVDDRETLDELPVRFGQTCVDILDPRYPTHAVGCPSRYLTRHYELYISNSKLLPREKELAVFRRAMSAAYCSPCAVPSSGVE